MCFREGVNNVVNHSLSIVGACDGNSFLCELVEGCGVEDIPPVLHRIRELFKNLQRASSP
jgi:hypothetical protein